VSEATTEGAPAPEAGEEAAWASLRARWDDEDAHRAFLSGVNDLEGLARAGARYRAVLADLPGDPAALRGRDDVLRKAAVLGLAAVPRTSPPRSSPPWVRGGLLAALGALLLGAAAWTAMTLFRVGGAR